MVGNNLLIDAETYMPNKLVSIVVPSYNHERFIEETLDSAVAQTYRPLEIVIVDDGSTDKSTKVIRQWILQNKKQSEIFIRAFFRKNHGAHECLNFGIKKSSGQAIAILNSDDIYAPQRIELMVRPIFSGKTNVTMSLVKFIDYESNILLANDPRGSWYAADTSTRFRYAGLSRALLHRPIHISTSNFVFSRKLLDQVHGFQNYRWVHDYDFIMRACIYTEPFLFSRHLLFYRTHTSNTISSRYQNLELFTQEIRRVLEDYFEESSLCHDQKIPMNVYAPSPYHWPARFKQTYAYGQPFVDGYSFLTELSLCNKFIFGSNKFEIGSRLEPFLEHPGDDRNSLKSMPFYHYLHHSNFEHKTDRRIRILKLIAADVVKNKGAAIGTLLCVNADIDLPYNEKLGLIGVFCNNTLVAILRFQKSTKGLSEFKGFSSEDLSQHKNRDLKLCWLDFYGTVLICKWKKKPKFSRSKKSKVKPTISGHLDMSFLDRVYLNIQAWALIDGRPPETIELFINNEKFNALPELEPRQDLRHLMKNPNSFGIAGFRFYIPKHLLPQSKQLKLEIVAKACGGIVKLNKVIPFDKR